MLLFRVISNASVNSVEKGFTVTVTGTLEKTAPTMRIPEVQEALSDAEPVCRSVILMYIN